MSVRVSNVCSSVPFLKSVASAGRLSDWSDRSVRPSVGQSVGLIGIRLLRLEGE